jgi:hypothetical protein
MIVNDELEKTQTWSILRYFHEVCLEAQSKKSSTKTSSGLDAEI